VERCEYWMHHAEKSGSSKARLQCMYGTRDEGPGAITSSSSSSSSSSSANLFAYDEADTRVQSLLALELRLALLVNLARVPNGRYGHTYMHTYIHAYIHTCIHACIHACIH
jgi:hypothetical protein